MVGIGAAITDKDSIITSYRDHCTHLVKGGTLLEVRPHNAERQCVLLHCTAGATFMRSTQAHMC